MTKSKKKKQLLVQFHLKIWLRRYVKRLKDAFYFFMHFTCGAEPIHQQGGPPYKRKVLVF